MKHCIPFKFKPYLICLFERGKNIGVPMTQAFINKMERMIHSVKGSVVYMWNIATGILNREESILNSEYNTRKWECTVLMVSGAYVGNHKNKRKQKN